jgi:hypothetical protein
MIKPEFWEDSKIGKLSDKAKLLFIAMWNFADDEGYLESTDEWIKIKCFPYEKEIKVSDFIEELLSNELIMTQNGVIRIKNFLKHQKIKKPSQSILKEQFERRLQDQEGVSQKFSTGGEEVGKEFCTGREGVPSPYYKLKEVKGREDKEKLKEGKGSVKGKETENDKTDFSFVEKQGTADGTETTQAKNGMITGTTMPQASDAVSESPPKETMSQTNSWGLDIINSTSVETFKARVEYAKSLGIEESVARRICNFAQSKKVALCEMHYKGFVGKSVKEAEEAFNLLKFLAKRGKSSSGLKRINSS